MAEDPIRLSAIDFFNDLLPEVINEQVKIEFELMEGDGEPVYLMEVMPCSSSPSQEEYTQIVRNAAKAIHERLEKAAAFLAHKYNL